MIDTSLYDALLRLSFLLALVTFTTLFFVNAPYGRHVGREWGPVVPNHIGWIVMEAPAALVFALCFVTGTAAKSLTAFVFLGLWEAHYIHRAFIYPFQIADGRKKMTLLVILMGFTFNCGNAYINGVYLFSLSGGYPVKWLSDPRFISGAMLFALGFTLNRWADRRLRKLRAPGETGYKIPHGGLFERVSCPNYLGEIIEWSGWALATWSLAGLSFAVWTFANLAPRARAHHLWYRQNFAEYPRKRKALIPGVW
jgi:protein-S-isoprenylcysteine O-methyltransferase Ste14